MAILGTFYGGRDYEPSSLTLTMNVVNLMSNETWDQEAFEGFIPVAREKVEFAARFI